MATYTKETQLQAVRQANLQNARDIQAQQDADMKESQIRNAKRRATEALQHANKSMTATKDAKKYSAPQLEALGDFELVHTSTIRDNFIAEVTAIEQRFDNTFYIQGRPTTLDELLG